MNAMTEPKPEPDRRVLKTKTALRDAMLALMVHKGWDEITIQAICEQANVGRSTFYIHYQSKEELLAQGLDDLRDMLIAQSSDTEGPDFPFLRGLLDHMAQQREVFKAAIGRRSGHGVVRRFKEMVLQLVEAEINRQRHPAVNKPWVARFVSGAIVETMVWWVDTPTPPPINDMVNELNQLVQRVVNRDRDLHVSNPVDGTESHRLAVASRY
jgi:AcrR family transcriptional regulator